MRIPNSTVWLQPERINRLGEHAPMSQTCLLIHWHASQRSSSVQHRQARHPAQGEPPSPALPNWCLTNIAFTHKTRIHRAAVPKEGLILAWTGTCVSTNCTQQHHKRSLPSASTQRWGTRRHRRLPLSLWSAGLLLLAQREQGRAIGPKRNPYLPLSPYHKPINAAFVCKAWRQPRSLGAKSRRC